MANDMPDASNSMIPATAKRRTILRAIVARAVVYGGIVLAMAVYIVGFRGLLPREISGSRGAASTQSPHPRPLSQSERDECNWPQWRGMHYDGHSAETALADTWPAEGPPVLWMRDIGQGYSSVIGVDGHVYTQTQSLTEQKVLALHADTGETIWEHRYGWPYDPGGMYPGPRSTPTWHDGKLYIAAPDGLTLCLNAAAGHEIWSANINEKFRGRGTEFGYSCSPVVEDGKVILPVGGSFASVVALDAATGATVWKSGSALASYCTPLPITFAGRRQVVVFLQNELAGFDLKSGLMLWSRLYSTGYDEHAAAPLYDEPYLRTMQPFRGGSDLYKLGRLSPEVPSTANDNEKSDFQDCRLKLLRTDKQMSNDVASSVLVGGYVYGFDLREIQSRRQRPSRGAFRCMDFKTGEIRWSEKTLGQATIAVAENKLYLFNDRGEAMLLRVNPDRCEELARTEVFRGEICWTAPCLHRGRLYLRSPTKLACLYVGKPENLEHAAREKSKPTSEIPKEKWVELHWLVGAERDAAFDLPDAGELALWYWYCLATIGVSAASAGCIYGMLRLRRTEPERGLAVTTFYLGLLVCGIMATPLGNRLSDQFVFTWPLALFAAQQIALMCVFLARQANRQNKSWLGVLGTVFLIFFCMIYYDLTRQLSLGAAWYFLPTFLAAWPLAVPAARRVARQASFWVDMIWFFAAFSLYFWTSAGLMLWRTTGGN